MLYWIRSPEVRLFEHLAVEDALLDATGGKGPVLMIWRGPRSVVMGKNQNPWKECNLGVIREKGLLLGRRVSGGGAVYHDPGNLNFSWVMERKTYDPGILHGILRDALARFGLKAETAATGGVRIEGFKVSGAAYCFRQDRVLHHGTLLWKADLPTLRAALSAPRVRLKTHAVASIPARVGNLSDWLPHEEAEDVVEALAGAAEKHFGARVDWPLEAVDPEDRPGRLQSAEWIWGQTPRFEVQIHVQGDPMTLRIHRGRLEKVCWRGAEWRGAEGARFGLEGCPVLAEHFGVESAEIVRAFGEEGWVWWS